MFVPLRLHGDGGQFQLEKTKMKKLAAKRSLVKEQKGERCLAEGLKKVKKLAAKSKESPKDGARGGRCYPPAICEAGWWQCTKLYPTYARWPKWP